MANDISILQNRILARALRIARKKAMFIRTVNHDLTDQLKDLGDTVDIPLAASVGTRAVVPSNVKPANVDNALTKTSIKLTQWRQNDPINVKDNEWSLINVRKDWLPPLLEAAVVSLVQESNVFMWRKYRRVFSVYGTPDVTPFASDVKAITRPDAILNANRVPRDGGRRMILDFTAEAQLKELTAVADWDKVNTTDIKIDGEIGRRYGIDFYSDDDVPYHVAGTISNASAARACAVNNGAGYAVGTNTMNVDAGASATVVGTIVAGDIITFANHAQTYAVIPNTSSGNFVPDAGGDTDAGVYTFATNAISGLSIYPALQTAVPDNTAITVMASHRVNLLFHREAFAFGERVLDTGEDMGPGTDLAKLTDDKTGIVMRLERSRQHKQQMWEFDWLYGGELVQPAWAVRVLG